MTDRLLTDAEIAVIEARERNGTKQRCGAFPIRFIIADSQKDVAALLSSHRALKAENFALAAGQCIVDGGLVGHENGSPICTLQVLQHDNARLVAQRDIDIGILLSAIRHMEEATGEPPDDPLVDKVRADYEDRKVAAKPGDGK